MSEPQAGAPSDESPFPTETEIYILPDGRVVFADLPLELVTLAGVLGPAEACDAAPSPEEGPSEQNHAALPDD